MDDPLVTEDRVPSYEKVKEKIGQIDNTIIIIRTFYNFDNLTYRFQLIKKEKMCVMEIPKGLLDDLKNDGSSAEQELTDILKLYIENSDCWTYVAR
ncbi:MAG TPA: hypothetical protein ENH31_07410 [Nitrospirae bacterium]|nr:hypothetical protein BMS3Abin10_01530 [bacterium BMS3Abin10]GBE37587.1 hypothetical protein BMS3Bbin08_00177 [bacterium BMS3Bbin08]HDH50001.1 hypothetical protein [Nitrospirota bacterium]HDK16365.1 hypothetical protein [Nitrospirota bacterium]HDK82384.1 hypothetical protein [Nitrospirota bacterium]